MRPLWKTVCLVAYFIIFASLASMAQCGNTLQSITYDTLISGTGNDSHVFTVSQFDPSIGTLVSAKINSNISVNYGFTLKNVEAVQRDFSVSVGRYDHYTSTALSTPYTNLIDTSIGDFLLNPGDTVSKAPYTILSHYSLSDSITTSVVNFLGSSTMDFDYKPITYTNLTGSNIYYYSATANDTIHFSITYYYCNNSILANDIVSLSAIRENESAIKLSWLTSNYQAGRIYEVQSATDSIQFSSAGSVTGEIDKYNYQYDYKIDPARTGKIFFRLKMISISGEAKYSEIKMLDLGGGYVNGKNIFVYPNPSDDFINIIFNIPESRNWDTWIYSSSGRLIQKEHFANISAAHIYFRNKLSTGAYFIKAQSIETKKNYVLSFIVR